MPTATERAKAQARYLKAIYAVSKEKYEASKEPFPIDTQNRVLFDVNLKDIHKYYQSTEKDKIIESDLPAFKAQLENDLGHRIQNATTVSWDLQGQYPPEGETPNANLLSSKLSGLGVKDSETLAFQGLAKGRIVSLQQETHFHAHLIGEMVKAAVTEDLNNGNEDQKRLKKTVKLAREATFGRTDEQFEKGLEKALQALNNAVLNQQAKALKKAYKIAAKKNPFDQELFATTLNKALDEARVDLLPHIAKKVRSELIKSTGIQFTKDITKYLTEHLAEATRASDKDLVHFDKGMGFVSFIGATEHTSHNQGLGADFVADCMMYSHHLFEETKQVTALSHRQQVRVPSIAVKELHPMTMKLLNMHLGEEKFTADTLTIQADDKFFQGQVLSSKELKQISDEFVAVNKLIKENPVTEQKISEAISQLILDDTIAKIAHLQDKYKLAGDTRENSAAQTILSPPLQHAFVYNLYTTLNEDNIAGRIDEASNKQSESAEFILKAAHLYNRDNPGKPLCLVQNMAVNGWGHELSISDKNPDLVNEAALMTQMASLHTIYDCIDIRSQLLVKKDLFYAYNAFLVSNNSTSFYSYLKDNRPDVLTTLQTLKQNIQLEEHKDIPTDHRLEFATSAKVALAALFKEGAFGHRENGYTYQALSVFVEESSIGGCKSANERAQAVNGRVSILDFMSLPINTRNDLLKKYLSPDESKRLIAESIDLETAIKERDTTNIKNHLDNLYQSLNLEGFQAIVSLMDQGGHAKLATNKGYFSDTNHSETVKTHVKNAAEWQCHKGLVKNVQKEFGVEKDLSLTKEFQNVFKTMGAGALFGAIGGSGAIGVLAILVAAGVSVAFPPIGMTIAAAVVAVTVVATVLAVGIFIKKAWNARGAATDARYEALQNDNGKLIDEGKSSIELPAVKKNISDEFVAENPIHFSDNLATKTDPVINNNLNNSYPVTVAGLSSHNSSFDSTDKLHHDPLSKASLDEIKKTTNGIDAVLVNLDDPDDPNKDQISKKPD